MGGMHVAALASYSQRCVVPGCCAVSSWSSLRGVSVALRQPASVSIRRGAGCRAACMPCVSHDMIMCSILPDPANRWCSTQLPSDTTGINSSHVVHKLSFGSSEFPGQVNPLDGVLARSTLPDGTAVPFPQHPDFSRCFQTTHVVLLHVLCLPACHGLNGCVV